MDKELMELKKTASKELFELILFFAEEAKRNKNSAILRDIAELYSKL
ncbi:hypothetical protein [Enterococcus mundtii]|nr:hypothetical protein [Enterococcus mundtii]